MFFLPKAIDVIYIIKRPFQLLERIRIFNVAYNLLEGGFSSK